MMIQSDFEIFRNHTWKNLVPQMFKATVIFEPIGVFRILQFTSILPVYYGKRFVLLT